MHQNQNILWIKVNKIVILVYDMHYCYKYTIRLVCLNWKRWIDMPQVCYCSNIKRQESQSVTPLLHKMPNKQINIRLLVIGLLHKHLLSSHLLRHNINTFIHSVFCNKFRTVKGMCLLDFSLYVDSLYKNWESVCVMVNRCDREH